jgi:hypothetical protein
MREFARDRALATSWWSGQTDDLHDP